MEIVEGIMIGQFSAFRLLKHADSASANEQRTQGSKSGFKTSSGIR